MKKKIKFSTKYRFNVIVTALRCSQHLTKTAFYRNSILLMFSFFCLYSYVSYSCADDIIDLLNTPCSGEECVRMAKEQGLTYDDFHSGLSELSKDEGRIARIHHLMKYYQSKPVSAIPRLSLDKIEKSDMSLSQTSPKKRRTPRDIFKAILSPRFCRYGSPLKKGKSIDSVVVPRHELFLDRITYFIQQEEKLDALQVLYILDRNNILTEENLKKIFVSSKEQQDILDYIIKMLPNRSNMRTIFFALENPTKDSKSVIENIIKMSDFDIEEEDVSFVSSLLECNQKKKSKDLIRFAKSKATERKKGTDSKKSRYSKRKLSFGSQILTSRVKRIEDISNKRMDEESVRSLIVYFFSEYQKSTCRLSLGNVEDWIDDPLYFDEYHQYRKFRTKVFEFFHQLSVLYQNGSEHEYFISNMVEILNKSFLLGHLSLCHDIILAMSDSISSDFWSKWSTLGVYQGFKNPIDIENFVKSEYRNLLVTKKMSPRKGAKILPFDVFFEDARKAIEGYKTEGTDGAKILKAEAIQTLKEVLQNIQNMSEIESKDFATSSDNPFLGLLDDKQDCVSISSTEMEIY